MQIISHLHHPTAMKETTHQEKELREDSLEEKFGSVYGYDQDTGSESGEEYYDITEEIKSFIRHLRSQDLARLKGEVDKIVPVGLGKSDREEQLIWKSDVLEVIDNYQSKD